MFDLNDLERATGFSKDQLRDRLGALGATLAKDRQQGPRGKTLVGDPTLAALRRLKELEDGGLSPKVAVERVSDELENTELAGSPNVGEASPSSTKVADVLIEELRHDKEHLREMLKAKDDELARVIALLEQAQAQLQAMLPASSDGRQRLSRLVALRIALLGR